MHVSAHEDNAGALILAKKLPPQYTPWKKTYAIKITRFCEEIVKRGMKLVKIDNIEQLGDMFTKALPRFILNILDQNSWVGKYSQCKFALEKECWVNVEY